LSASAELLVLKLRMMEVVVTTGAIRSAKLQSHCHLSPPTNQHLLSLGLAIGRASGL